MGSAPSARWIQPGGSGRPFRRVRIPSGDRRPVGLGLRRAHFLLAVRRDRLWVGQEGLGGEGGYPLRRRALQRPPAPTSPFPGAADTCTSALSLPSGRDGAPRPRRGCRPGRTVLSPRLTAPRRQDGDRLTFRALGVCGEAATHPTRLETRTKESNARASQGARQTPRRNEGEGRRAPCLGGIPAPRRRAHHRPVSPAPSGRWSKSARDRTRKMVNYAWAGRSQRKLWWRPVAVLTCKSVVRPGYRGERLIEPSGSWFPPKFPSG